MHEPIRFHRFPLPEINAMTAQPRVLLQGTRTINMALGSSIAALMYR